MEKIELYRCLVCGTIHTRASAFRHEKEHQGHKAVLLTDSEHRKYGLALTPSSCDSDTEFKADPKYLTKKAIYIGMRGKEIQSRRTGSRVEIQYGYNDPVACKNMILNTIEFYQLLFTAKEVDPIRLHTCSSMTNSGLSSYMSIRGKLAQLQPDSCFVIAFYYDTQLFLLPYSHGNAFERYLDYPLRAFIGYSRHANVDNRTAEKLLKLEHDRTQGTEHHYDLLSPRNDINSVILVTSVNLLSGKQLVELKFLMFEITRTEYAQILDKGELGCIDITNKAKEVLIQ